MREQPIEQATDDAAVRRQGSFAKTFEALRYRDFRYLWLAQMTNSAAQWMQMVGLPVLVIAVTSSEIHLGMVLFVRMVPALALGLLSGVFADIWDRRTILIVTRVVGTGLAIWFAVINVIGSVALVDIYVFALLRGATMAFDQAPRRALIPSMVPRGTVVNAMAVSTGGMQLMRLLAASGAGTLIALFGIPSVFVALAVLYVIGIPLLLLMRAQEQERTGYRGLRVMAGDAGEGLAFAWRTPTVRGALIIAATFFVFGMSFTHVFAPLIAETMGLTQGALGWMLAIMGVGGTCGTLLMAYGSPSHHRGIVLIVSMAAFGLLLTAVAGGSYLSTPWVVFGMVWLIGAGQSVFMPLLSTLVLQAAPDHLRGRAMSLLGFDRALVSFGSMVAGFAAAAFGSQLALLGFGAGCVAAAIVLLSSPLRKVD